VFLINLQMRLNNLEIHRSADMVEGEAKVGRTSESAIVFESIQGVNELIKQAMKQEMKCRGLSDDDIRYVFHMDHD